MKSLSIAKPLVIMIVGLPGAGKSYFAKQFADTFSVPLISNEDIRAELFTNPTFNKDENLIVGRIQDLMLEQMLKSKSSILMDLGSSTKQNRAKIAQIANQAKFETLVVWVQTNPELAKMRAVKNVTKPTRHTAITEQHFEAELKKFSAPTTENYVVISGMHTYTTQARAVLRKLAAKHTDKATQSKADDIAPRQPAKPPARGIIIR